MNKNLKKAKKLAQKIHKNESRLSGDTVVDHLFRVYDKLTNIGVEDENILVGALLHQCPTKDKSMLNQIKSNFDKDVVKIVKTYQNLSDTDIPCPNGTNINEKYIIQTYLNLAEDLRVLLIRLADKADNIKTAHALNPKKRQRVAQRAMYLYAPIARLLGLYKLTSDLENGAFKHLYPDKYFQIKKAVNKKRPFYDKFFKETTRVLKDLFEERSIDVVITYRIKHIYGIHKKAQQIMQKHDGIKIGKDYSGVFDMAAMRIIVNTKKQCYEVEDILNQIWEQIMEVRDDYIQNPKPSGYKSLHNHYKTRNGMQIEIQIRTHKMHEENEFGTASHVFYKVGNYFKDKLKDNPNWLKELHHWQEEKQLKEADTELKQFKNTVYAFTPKGDIIELPKDATAIDFAYSIHTSIGHSCVGAIVNDEIKKLTYKIQNGDRIKIQTSSSKKKPSADWMDIAKTSRAKTAIRKKLN